MSVGAVDWALRKAPVGSNQSARLVLIALANLVDDEGRDAHPPVSKLVAWLEMSESTVRRAMKYLEGEGLIRRGDQRLVSHFDEFHRPVVWDLVMTRERKLDLRDDPDKAKGGRKPGVRKTVGKPRKPGVKKNVGSTKPTVKTTPGFKRKPPVTHDTTQVSPVTDSTSLVRNNPSVPYGDISPAGENPPAETNPTKPETMLADWMSALLAGQHIQPNAKSRRRELQAARRLLDRTDLDTIQAMARWAVMHDWWQSTVRSLTALDRNWDTIRAQHHRDTQTRRPVDPTDRPLWPEPADKPDKPTPIPARHETSEHKHTAGCQHVTAIIQPIEHRFPTDRVGGRFGSSPRSQARQLAADMLNEGKDPSEIRGVLTGRLAPDELMQIA
ncbi:helix-turn-helix domain-containing protein [Bifidobacterium vansinderenii]|uniref:DNA-binding protein n=1 Tax=Bifidobacterium vansinderenii TaxID=1984871 RepID=A0A229W0Q0_9BIFI|nr:helix-turn-helix domain-containing protein [Bifidobacterium vansinderenii]OXN01453.1 DNA-binding protein [Bifidobacterium vansinderenii]